MNFLLKIFRQLSSFYLAAHVEKFVLTTNFWWKQRSW